MADAFNKAWTIVKESKKCPKCGEMKMTKMGCTKMGCN